MPIAPLKMPAARSNRIIWHPRLAVAGALAFVALGACLHWLSPHGPGEFANFLGVNLALVALVLMLARKKDSLAGPVLEPMLDPDTRVLNAPALYRECELELCRARRLKTPTTIIDIRLVRSPQQAVSDYLQLVEEGIDIVRDQLRNTDIIGRYSTEEFVVALSAAGELGRDIVVERLRGSLGNFFAPQDIVITARTFATPPETAHIAIKSTRMPRELLLKTSA
jgi:hypothetical protein